MPAVFNFQLALALWIGPAGFAHAQVGNLLPNPRLPDLQGHWHHLIDTNATVNVFVFFHPTKPHSLDTLRKLANLEQRLADRPIHWVAIVSGRFKSAQIRQAVHETGLHMPVVVDRGDALYGRLGVKLYPVVGVADRAGRLKHYLHFREVNYIPMIEACVRFELGEITRPQLEAVLHPPVTRLDKTPPWEARRWLHLAQRLFERKQYRKALKAVDHSLQYNPDQAQALVLKGRILAALDQVEAARKALRRALELDSGNAEAQRILDTLPHSAETPRK